MSVFLLSTSPPFTRRYKNMLQRLGVYSPRRVAVLLPHEMLLNHVV